MHPASAPLLLVVPSRLQMQKQSVPFVFPPPQSVPVTPSVTLKKSQKPCAAYKRSNTVCTRKRYSKKTDKTYWFMNSEARRSVTPSFKPGKVFKDFDDFKNEVDVYMANQSTG